MKETLPTIEFDCGDRDELDELMQFEKAYGRELSITPECTLKIDDGAKIYECEVNLRREAGTYYVTTRVPAVPATIAPYSRALERELPLDEWQKALTAFPDPENTVEYSIEVGYRKQQDVGDAAFVAYTEEGLYAIRTEIRDRLLTGRTFEGLTVLTPLVGDPISGTGILLAPVAHRGRHKPIAKKLLIPEHSPTDVHTALALIQADHVGLVILERDFGPTPQFDLASILQLATWLEDHPFRRTLARRHLVEKPLPATTRDLIGLTETLALLEGDLIGDTLKKFETASTTFREISIELLRDLHKMRGEILSLVGTELFQMCVTIAAIVAGLTIGELAAVPVIYGVSLLVGFVFFAGALLKARTQEREFRDLIDFNREFAQLPVAHTMPQFHSWYARTVKQSIRSFYSSLSIGIPIAAVPLCGVIAFSTHAKWPALPVWAVFLSLAAIAIAGGAIHWIVCPRARLIKEVERHTLPVSSPSPAT